MNSAAYWSKRSAGLMYDRMEDAEKIASEVADLYRQAARQVEAEMRKIVGTFSSRFGLDDDTALKLLASLTNPADFYALKQQLIASGSDKDLLFAAELDSPAYQARLARLRDLYEQIDEIGQDLYIKDMNIERKWYSIMGQDAYYRSIYDTQRQVGFQFSFAHIDADLVQGIMNTGWGGATFSQRIWSNVNALTDDVRKQLALGLITGRSEKQIAKEIANKYQTGAFEARRLIRTESCWLSSEMQAKAYEECGAEYYVYIATLDTRTDEECGALDLKRFKLSERKPGTNCPPMHPFCRCTTRIYLDATDMQGLKRRARDPETGRNVLVPAGMNYTEWLYANGLLTWEGTGK